MKKKCLNIILKFNLSRKFGQSEKSYSIAKFWWFFSRNEHPKRLRRLRVKRIFTWLARTSFICMGTASRYIGNLGLRADKIRASWLVARTLSNSFAAMILESALGTKHIWLCSVFWTSGSNCAKIREGSKYFTFLGLFTFNENKKYLIFR